MTYSQNKWIGDLFGMSSKMDFKPKLHSLKKVEIHRTIIATDLFWSIFAWIWSRYAR